MRQLSRHDPGDNVLTGQAMQQVQQRLAAMQAELIDDAPHPVDDAAVRAIAQARNVA